MTVGFGAYHHHGIASENGRVVHFGRGIFDGENAVVEEVPLAVFGQGKPIKEVDSKVCFDGAEIVSRARGRIGSRGYDLFENNCEHFANWCRSGQNESHQVNLSETILRQSTATCAKSWIRKVAINVATKSTGSHLAQGAVRSVVGAPVLAASLVGDAVQSTVEIVANKRGKTRNETRRIGRQAGVTSSVAIGWIIGGPVTAAMGGGLWFAGQVAGCRAIETGKQLLGRTMQRVQT